MLMFMPTLNASLSRLSQSHPDACSANSELYYYVGLHNTAGGPDAADEQDSGAGQRAHTGRGASRLYRQCRRDRAIGGGRSAITQSHDTGDIRFYVRPGT